MFIFSSPPSYIAHFIYRFFGKMERSLGIIPSGFTDGGSAGINTPAMPVDEAYLNGCFSELSFKSILQPLCSYDGAALLLSHSQKSPSPMPAVESTAFSPVTYDYFNQEFPAGTSEYPNSYQFLNPTPKMPKIEVLDPQDFAFQLLKLNNTPPNDTVLSTEPLINFFSTPSTTTTTSSAVDGGCLSFSHLPHQDPTTPAQPKFQTGSLNDIVNRVGSAASSPWMNNPNRYMPYKTSGLARQRRQRISEKTRCLQKLLPWDKKMDTGTMLEEAYKYVKFLQAQIRVLETMPIKTNQNPSYDVGSSSSSNVGEKDVVWGELGKLNRQQLLEVVVNSPVAQTVLYSRGCCVFSAEQLVLLKKMAEKKALLEKVLFASPLLFPYQ